MSSAVSPDACRLALRRCQWRFRLGKLSLPLTDEVIRLVQPVPLDGLPVEWLSTRAPDHRTAVIANHDGQPWRGTVALRAVSAEFTECREF